MPRPLVAGGPLIIIGGNDPNRTLPLAARYANEWNAIFVPAKRFSELSAHLDELPRAAGRSLELVRRTLMTLYTLRACTFPPCLNSSLHNLSQTTGSAFTIRPLHPGLPVQRHLPP
jgi:hypothetical protein